MSRRFRWGFVSLLFVVLGIITGLQVYYLYDREPFGVRVWTGLKETVTFSATWLVLTPFILMLVERFPLVRARLSWSLPIHLVASVVIGATNRVLLLLAMPLAAGVWPVRYDPQRMMRDVVLRLDLQALLYWAVVAVYEGLSWYMKVQESQRRQAELEARLTGARLEALRMQLQPHFLFNTLHTISSMIHTDPNGADLMVVRLSEFLRMSLENSASQEAPLEEELEFIERYLEIERIRFHDRLKVLYDIPSDTLDATVPRLILQPLVENAIKHGVSKVSGPGSVRITARAGEGKLTLAVRDNGPGFENGSPSQCNRIGLRNTRERLERLYGREQQLVLRNLDKGGVEATVTIPFRPSGAES